jgi:hypothetical protein
MTLTRKHKIRTVLATVAALGVSLTALTGVASASGADTKVVIKAESGGFFGYVKSPDPDTCANNRKVTLFEQLGSTQDPSTDTKVGSDIAEPNGTKYMWSTGNTGSHSGNFYARAGKVPGCKAATSKTIPAQA